MILALISLWILSVGEDKLQNKNNSIFFYLLKIFLNNFLRYKIYVKNNSHKFLVDFYPKFFSVYLFIYLSLLFLFINKTNKICWIKFCFSHKLPNDFLARDIKVHKIIDHWNEKSVWGPCACVQCIISYSVLYIIILIRQQILIIPRMGILSLGWN